MPSKAAQKRGEHLAMTTAAQAAYDNPAAHNPHAPTASHLDNAWRIGRWLACTSQKRPSGISPSYTWVYHVCLGNPLAEVFKVRVPWFRSADPHRIEK